MPLDSYDQVAHLLRRAGFGAPPNVIDQKAAQGVEATVNELLNFESIPDNVAPDPALVNLLALSPDAFQSQIGTFIGGMERWWLNAMITTDRSLQEKMVLFWHGLFATSTEGVLDVRQMYLQNENFRGYFEPDTGLITRPNPKSPFPVGNFRDILIYLTKDSAMLFWLDNVFNQRLNSEVGTNENYSRELHELFSMGVVDPVTGAPNYTEQDIRQASRALTGWTIEPPDRRNPALLKKFRFAPEIHDFGPYTVLGVRFQGDGSQLFNIIVQYINRNNPAEAQQSAVGRFLGYRLFKFFGYDEPEPEIVSALADVFDGKNGEQPYNIRNLLRTIFMPGNPVSEAFYSDPAFKAHVKSPTEYVIGTYRLLKPEGISANPLELQLVLGVGRGGQSTSGMIQMGQWLFYPPDVSGWKEGLNWINTTFDMARFNFANNYTTLGRAQGGIDADTLVQSIIGRPIARGQTPTAAEIEQIVDHLTALMLQVPISSEARQHFIDYMNAPSENSFDNDFVNMKVRGLIWLIMATQEYQLG